ncbi:MAG: hypothetical protein Q9220_003807 [cf. Caloplaca sp. 1 TL-2023]
MSTPAPAPAEATIAEGSFQLTGSFVPTSTRNGTEGSIDDLVVSTAAEVTEDSTAEPTDRCFGRLITSNQAAREAFSSVVNAMNDNRIDYSHHSRFIYAAEDDSRVDSDESSDDEGAETTTDRQVKDSSARSWNGGFKLSLGTVADGSTGWAIGSASSNICDAQPELCMSIKKDPSATAAKVRSLHAHLFFHPESYGLMIRAHHTLTVAGRTGIQELRKNDHRALQNGDAIMIGYCFYRLEYAAYSDSQYFARELRTFMKSHSPLSIDLHHAMNGPSTARGIIIGDYFCSAGAFASGAFGEVMAGRGPSGELVAIKRFKAPKQESIESHKSIMEKIGSHPLADGSLTAIANRYTINVAAQLYLLRDWLRGLSYLHRKGIMHRDICPNNLGVLRRDPPQGVILDLDGAIEAEFDNEWRLGTLPFTAPEIIDLRLGATDTPYQPEWMPYSNSVDVWSLGLSALVMDKGSLPPWWQYDTTNVQPNEDNSKPKGGNYVTEARYEGFSKRLERKFQDATEAGSKERLAFLKVCQWMTVYESEFRATATPMLHYTENAIYDLTTQPMISLQSPTSQESGTKRGHDVVDEGQRESSHNAEPAAKRKKSG